MRCTVCESPHLESVNYLLLSQERSHADIARMFSLHKDRIGRHFRGKHWERKVNALAVATEAGAFIPASTTAKKLQAFENTQSALLGRAESLMDAAESFYDRFKDSTNAKDIKAALDSCRDALRLLGDLQGAFPKATATTNIDARSVTLNGLTQDDLKTLISGIKALQQANTFDG